MIVTAFLLLLKVCDAYSYYAGPGTDTVIHDGADAFELLQTVAKPTNLKHIKILKLSPREIPDNSYPYPGRAIDDAYWTDICNETNKIFSTYRAVNKTTADQYYHPAGLLQYGGNADDISIADRVKVRLVLNNYYSHYHITPLFIPPGELLTIEYVNEKAQRSVNLRLNGNSPTFGCDDKTRRLSAIQTDILLTEKTNKIIWPYGGQIAFTWSSRDVYPQGDSPIELIISGAILTSIFVYGVDDDLEFEKQLTERAGPFCSFDSGNVIGQGTVQYVKEIKKIRASDCMRILRSRGRIAQKTARDNDNYGNDQDGRTRHPNLWFFDQYMAPGAAAYAVVGANYCQFNPPVIRSQFNYDTIIRGGWGENHEQNHHHQQNWGVGYTGEVTNNVVNLVAYALTADSLARIDRGNGNFGHGTTSGEDHTHNYFDLWGENDDNLAFWNNLIHSFGCKKFQEFIRSDQQNTLFSKSTYGSEGAELLRASKIFGYNMIHHFNFHCHSNETITNNGAYTTIFTELAAMNLPFFHPITNFYTNGHVVNGEEFITVNPFAVPGDFKYLFEFDKYVKTREECKLASPKTGGKDLWGHFDFVRLEGRTGGWREISKSRYEYTPPANVTAIDKFYLIYKDTTTNQEQKLVGTLRQKLGLAQVIRYDNVLEENGNKFNDVFKAYEAAVKKDLTALSFTSSFHTGSFDSGATGTYVSIAAGSFKVPEDSVYTFYLKDDDKGMFYLSDKELKLDPNQDKDYLLISSNGELTSYTDSYKSPEQTLVKDKLYYFAIVCYNTGGPGYAQAGVKYGSMTTASDIPSNWIASKKDSSAETIKKLEFVPDWHEIPDLNKWKGIKSLDVDSSNFKVTAAPPEQNDVDPSVIFDPSTDQLKTYFGKWWQYIAVPLPHNYDIDFQKEISFGFINYVTSPNPAYPTDSNIEIYLSSVNGTLDNADNLIYKGHYKTANPIIPFDKTMKGRYFRLRILDNVNWGPSYAERRTSCIAYLSFGFQLSDNYQYVIPSTSTKIHVKGESSYSRKSIGFNGKTLITKKNSEMYSVFPKGTKEIMVVGDKYEGMGSATFYVDDVEFGDLDRQNYYADVKNLQYASRSYRSILFQTGKLDESRKHVLKMVVTSGEINIAGFVSNVEYLEDYISPPTSSSDGKPTNSDSTPVSTNSDGTGGDSSSGDSNKDGKSSKSTPIIIGAVVGIVAVAAAVVGVVVYLKKCRPPAKSVNTMVTEPETNFGTESQVVDPYDLDI